MAEVETSFVLPQDMDIQVETMWGNIEISMIDNNSLYIFFDSSEYIEEGWFQEGGMEIPFDKNNFETLLDKLRTVINIAIEGGLYNKSGGFDVQDKILSALTQYGFTVSTDLDLTMDEG
ncbi:MAG: hypothetical protein ABIM99_05870 [Candidatus Dojkabacteria bacterium]